MVNVLRKSKNGFWDWGHYVQRASWSTLSEYRLLWLRHVQTPQFHPNGEFDFY